jgi:Tfp pilus assembly protein PilO
MENYNSLGSYTRSTVKIGVRQHVRSRKGFNLAARLAEWKQAGKIVIWILPVLLILNVMCSSAISSMNHSITEISTSAQSLETKNVELLAEKAILGSEVSVRNLAAEKLGLAEVKRGQVGVFNRQFGTFDYR